MLIVMSHDTRYHGEVKLETPRFLFNVAGSMMMSLTMEELAE